jgi:hypothetical protein
VPEQSLHNQLKEWYRRPGDRLEVDVDGFVADIVRGELIIEIQTGNFSTIRDKFGELLKAHRVRLVYPISERKWVVRVDGDRLTRRLSPKRGRVEDIFNELVYMPKLAREPGFSLEALLVHSEDVLVNDGLGSWRRRRWSMQDRKLIDVEDRVLLEKPGDYLSLLPETLPETFTSKDISSASNVRPSLARKMAYCLCRMGVMEELDKKGRSKIYRIPDRRNRKGIDVDGVSHSKG